ncbi:hypothetical protein V6N11_001553 [Hibiscus sabdariffa]|uniref:Uncharacterized protein n=1 Tax=Hibiscus sabdariffa TaxID=183260 RepID=A0ABR2S048_9ROSI
MHKVICEAGQGRGNFCVSSRPTCELLRLWGPALRQKNAKFCLTLSLEVVAPQYPTSQLSHKGASLLDPSTTLNDEIIIFKWWEEQRNNMKNQLSRLESKVEENPRYLEKILNWLSKEGIIFNSTYVGMKQDWLWKATDVVKVLDERLMRNDAVQMDEVKLPKSAQNYMRNLMA